MTIHELPIAFEMNTVRPPRYSVGVSVLAVVGLALAGWIGIGVAINAIF